MENNINHVHFGRHMDLNLPKKRKFENPAPPWKRAASFLIDYVIIQSIIISPFAGVLQSMVPMDLPAQEYLTNPPQASGNLVLLTLAVGALVLAYFVIFEYRMKQTPGKMLFGLRLAPMLKKQEIGLGTIVLRNLGAIPIFPFILLWIVDPLYMFITGYRLTDKFTKTQIIEEVEA